MPPTCPLRGQWAMGNGLCLYEASNRRFVRAMASEAKPYKALHTRPGLVRHALQSSALYARCPCLTKQSFVRHGQRAMGNGRSEQSSNAPCPIGARVTQSPYKGWSRHGDDDQPLCLVPRFGSLCHLWCHLWCQPYPNFPLVDAIKNAAYVKTYPAEKCANPTNRACTIDNATGLSFHLTRFASGVRSWAQARVSINSCQYPLHDIRNINPVA